MDKTANEYWVSLPSNKGEMPWTGRIKIEDGPQEHWTFDILREEKRSRAIDADPFKDKQSAVVLLDYQKNGTLIHPMTTTFNPGSVGYDYPVQRKRLEGSFSHLLDGLAVDSPTEEIFAGLAFDSEALRFWHSPNFGPSVNHGGKGSVIDTSVGDLESFDITGVGNFKIRSWNQHHQQRDLQTVRPHVTLSLTFDQPRSLLQTIEIAWALEFLFGFLIGYRLKRPNFRLWQTRTYTSGESEIPYYGYLVMGGTAWDPKRSADMFSVQHIRGQSVGRTEAVLTSFFQNRSSAMKNIFVVERARFFTNLVDQSFISILPTLEELLRQRYTTAEETSYLSQKDAFFAYVDASPDKSLLEFSKKHLQIKNSKAPGLKQVLERAIADIGDTAFEFPPDIADRIAARRHDLAHRTRSFEADEIPALVSETRAAVLLLMLLTYRDLGIPLSELSGEQMRFRWFCDFLKATRKQRSEA